MEPAFETARELEPVLSELAAREPIFHRPEFGTTRATIWRRGSKGWKALCHQGTIVADA